MDNQHLSLMNSSQRHGCFGRMPLTVLNIYPRVGIFLGAEAIPTLFRRSSGSISVLDPCVYK